jgi:hypothetical protein
MILFVNRLKKYFICVGFSFFALLTFFWWYSQVQAQNDLLKDMTDPAMQQGIMIDVWEGTQVWWRTIRGEDSIVVKATRFLLVLTIALSVTMILYNWMIYIIETWQGKEWKSLAKNVILIVVWILIALFSSIIIALIQSIPESTINTETSGAWVDKSVL